MSGRQGTPAEVCKRHGSQGAKVVTCARCKTDIPEYAGRRIAAYRETYAHQPGRCADAHTREATTRSLADQPGLFAWSCTHVEPAGDLPLFCNEHGTERDAYSEHMRQHGARELKPALPPIRLRKGAPAAPRQAPRVPAFKRAVWTVTEHVPTGEHWPAEQGGGPKYTEVRTEHRGQYWCNGADANSVVVIEDRRSLGLPNQLVTLWLDGAGRLTADWSGAKRSRRQANGRERDRKLWAERAAS